MKHLHHTFLFGICFLSACQARETSTISPKQPTIVAVHQMAGAQLEFALTPEQQQKGLMHRTHLSEHQGMLFAFNAPKLACFWMKNTLIPLSIGFVNEQGVLVQIEDMQAQTQTTHCAQTPVKYAIEMNQGWFERKNVTIGTQLLKIMP